MQLHPYQPLIRLQRHHPLAGRVEDPGGPRGLVAGRVHLGRQHVCLSLQPALLVLLAAGGGVTAIYPRVARALLRTLPTHAPAQQQATGGGGQRLRGRRGPHWGRKTRTCIGHNNPLPSAADWKCPTLRERPTAPRAPSPDRNPLHSRHHSRQVPTQHGEPSVVHSRVVKSVESVEYRPAELRGP